MLVDLCVGVMRKHTYRYSTEKGKDEVIEIIAGTSIPTGRIFRVAKGNEDTSMEDTVTVRDPVTNQGTLYVFDRRG